MALSAWTLARWRIAERRAAALAAARRALEGPETDADAVLRTLSPAAAEELAASARFPDPAADRAAAWLVAVNADRILPRAARGRPWWTRARALRVLARAGHPEAAALLERALGAGPAPLSAVAISALGRMPGRRAAELLLDALASGKHPASRIAAALERSAGDLADLLVPRLRHESPAVRYWSACLIAGDSADASAALADLARDADPRLRKAAVDALARIGSERAEAEGRRLLGDPVGYVRAHAARSLAAAAGPAAHDAIRGLAGDPEWPVRRALREILGPRAAAKAAP